MKKKLLISFSIILSTFLIWLTVYTIFAVNKEQINVAATSLENKVSASGGTGAPEVLASSHYGASSWGDRFLSIPGFDGNPMVHIETKGHLIYCINKNGGQLINAPTPEEIQAEADRINAGYPVYSYYNKCARYAYEGPISMTYWEPEGGSEKVLPDLAYIITYPGGEDLKQYAIWRRDGAAKGDGISHNTRGTGDGLFANKGLLKQADALLKEADTYAEYGEKLEENIAQDPNNALGLENTTDPNELVVLSENSEYITIGPLSMDYTDGRADGVTFGGIHDMWIEGYNVNGEKIVDKIEIDSFIIADEGSSSTNITGEEIEPEYFEPNTADKTYVDETEQLYPESGQKFYLKFKNPNYGNSGDVSTRVHKVGIQVEFQYMMAEATIIRMYGKHDQIYYAACEHEDLGDGNYICTMTRVRVDLASRAAQDTFEAMGYRYLYKQIITLIGELPGEDEPGEPGEPGEPDSPDDGIEITMKLGGYVWEDGKQGKETLADGRIAGSVTDGILTMGAPDRALPNIKVTLYEVDPGSNQGKEAQLMTTGEDEEILHNINPTITDENGYYQFNGLDISKKYYVKFEYNGQYYLPTDYLAGGGSIESMYNTDAWYTTSKALEEQSFRDGFDQRFAEIGAYPHNYRTVDDVLGVGEWNASFSMLELMGYELNENGQYSQSGAQLIDGYLYDSRGLQTEEWAEGAISQRIKEFIESNSAYPTESQLQSLYSEIAGGDQEMMQKLQFVWDCNIYANTSHGSGSESEYDLYPPFDNIVVHQITDSPGSDPNGNYKQVYDGWVATNDVTMSIRGGSSGEFKSVYDGQFYINLGLWKRHEFDMALMKDVYKAAVKINGKTHVSDYAQRNVREEAGQNTASGQDNNSSWDINVRLEQGYYDNPATYNREVRSSDYEYDNEALNHPGQELEVYITYVITVRNQSQSIEGVITEIVDYYDEDYILKPNLSWIMYGFGTPDDAAYEEMMEQDQDIINDNGNFLAGSLGDDAGASDTSIYSSTGSLSGYKTAYITGLSGHQLQSGEMASIYLTFQVDRGENGDRLKIQNTKDNIAEINGYQTYYRDGTSLPNGVSKGSGDVAGLVDRDSNPGNVDEDLAGVNLEAGNYEHYFEDDTDRAPGLSITLNETARQANGVVWEDDRTVDVDGAMIGNGIRDNGEIGIAGLTVQLVEKREDDGQQSEYVWFETQTGADGTYTFSNYIPGDYVIRFKYGDTDATAMTSSNGGSNATSYNGQDFKSTLYQYQIDESGNRSGLPQNAATDLDGRYAGYTDYATQNERNKYNAEKGSPRDDTYGYDIAAADAGANYSDAKDIWSVGDDDGIVVNTRGGDNAPFAEDSGYRLQGRETVNSYSEGAMTNYKAEVFASPYTGSSEYFGMFKEWTEMSAETGVIVAEVEYNKQHSGFDDDDENYVLANVDFGLTERPKAQLEVDKSIENINLTLANQTVLFDIVGRTNNALWQDHEEYGLEEVLQSSNGMYNNYYGTNHRYAYRTDVDNLISTTDKGLVQLTMDEELMHGATIRITYKVKITNVGEIDYIDSGDSKDFYYRGENTNTEIVTTSADQIIDCVHNNMQFDASDEKNSDWSLIKQETIESEGLVRQDLWATFDDFNNIIETSSSGGQAAKALVPYNGSNAEDSTEEKTLMLSQLITPENTDDDLTYNNMLEIVKITNTAGRRMAFSIVGNQNPLDNNPAEVDASAAERVIILPPFGQKPIYYVIGGMVGIILIVGIVLIIRKVLKNKNGKGLDGGSDGDDGGEPNGEPNNSPTEADSGSDGELDNSTEELDKSEGKEQGVDEKDLQEISDDGSDNGSDNEPQNGDTLASDDDK